MYPNTSPNDLYEEYQARVAAAVRDHAFAVELEETRTLEQPAGTAAGSGLRARWNHFRLRLVRAIKPAEEGSIA